MCSPAAGMEEFCFEGHTHTQEHHLRNLKTNKKQQRLVQRNPNNYSGSWENRVGGDPERKPEYAMEAWAGSLLYINQMGMFRKVHIVIR